MERLDGIGGLRHGHCSAPRTCGPLSARPPRATRRNPNTLADLRLGRLAISSIRFSQRDAEDFLTFYDFPEEHWLHLRTTNPIESVFAGVRLRTNAAKRMRVRENALYLVFKLVLRLSTNWRAINGRNQLSLLLAGERFVDGRLQRQPTTEGAAA